MCGIAGVFSASPLPDDCGQNLERMARLLAHRGPDGQGVWVADKVGFAHRRLAVIDLSDRAAQPMHTSDGQISCTFNGEIYNFAALRSELQGVGYRFLSDSDTEVLLHGYREWGHDLVDRLHGMFAFAIWDAPKQQLFLARDRFGKKPLFYAWFRGKFIFASELKAILSWPGFERKANLAAIHDYLSFKYTVGRNTAFEGVYKLEPARILCLDAAHTVDNPPVAVPYWDLPEPTAENDFPNSGTLEDQLFDRLDTAISKRLISDVPVGAFLSGGVDSSAIVARAAELKTGQLKTFSAGFNIQGFDETDYATRIAKQFGTEHYNFVMDDDLAADIPEMVWQYSDPFADASALITTALAKEVRQHVTVALSGDGGDEVFLGYQRYNRFSNDIQNARDAPLQSSVLDAHLKRAYGPVGAKAAYAKSMVALRDIHKEWGYGPGLVQFLLSPSSDRLPQVLETANGNTALACAGLADLNGYLPDDLMVKTDIATMATGLEARCPFLDHELVEWAAKIPQSKRTFLRNDQLELKGLLKRAFEPHMPHDILYRTKMGFRVPIAQWLRGSLRDFAFDLLTSTSFKERGLFRPQFIDWMLDAHASGREDHSTALWAFLILEVWFRTFIDRAPTGPISFPNSRIVTGPEVVAAK